MTGDPKTSGGADPALELAAKVSDGAAADGPAGNERSSGPPEGDVNETLDVRYRRALDEIAWLVERRQHRTYAGRDDDAEVGETYSREESTPKEWGPFELVERLGSGASGEVFKARDTHLDHHVALKLFHRRRPDAVGQEAILVEGRRHALVKHSNIATLHGADEYEGRVGIWMELIDGSTLQELVERQGPFGAAEALQIGITLCSALAAVHRQGLTHGDIKAQNVMREKGGRIVLMDFSSSRSIAKADEGAVLVGTPVYMAPELFHGSPPSLASDVYSVGVLLFFLVTGRYPIEARTLSELRESLSQGGRLLLHDLRPELPMSFIEAVHRASSPEPMERFSSVGRLQSALSAVLSERSSTAHDREGHPARGDVPASGDLQKLANAATYLTGLAGVAAFLALLGVLNDALFNVTLHVPEDFTSYSLASAVGVGFRSVVPCVILFLFNLAGLVALWALGAWAPKLRGFARGLAARVEAASPQALATAFTFAAILAVGAGSFAFRSLLGLLVTIAEEPHSVADVGLLCPSTYHDVFTLVFAELVILLTAAWIAIFYAPARRAERDPTFRLMKWLSLSVTLAAVIVMAAPWRLLTQSEVESFRIGAQEHYVIAEKDDDRFVYVPGAPPGERHRIMNQDVIPSGERKIENCFCGAP